jgi:hypothetical protein
LKLLIVEYISYHACPSDFILYIGEYVDKEICSKGGHERYHKSNKNGKSHGDPPHNILRHMPIIPRIQSIFPCKKLTMFQGCHASHISELGVMRIPIYSISMKHIENTWLEKFKDEAQSLRINITMDGVNPYSLKKTNCFFFL